LAFLEKVSSGGIAGIELCLQYEARSAESG
jgi:hypothetical protein